MWMSQRQRGTGSSVKPLKAKPWNGNVWQDERDSATNKNRFMSPSRGLPTNNVHPSQVELWIMRSRPGGTYAPPMDDINKYIQSYQEWWISLNPSWRTKNKAGDLIAVGSGPWGILHRPGINGLLAVFVCLKWWIDAIKVSNVGDKGQWAHAVLDVVWVLQGLMQATPTQVIKRPALPMDEEVVQVQKRTWKPYHPMQAYE